MITLILQQTLIITTFVMGMMMVIEYINVQTRGMWSQKLEKSPFTQIVLGAMMGIIPGCLGSYTMVSLYVHRVVMFPALVATLIATSGDEAFLMFSTIPATALKLTVILFAIALIAGVLTHIFVKNKFIGLRKEAMLPLHHQNESCNRYHPALIIENLRQISFTRALLIAGVLAILVSLLSGFVDGSHHLNTLMGATESALHTHDHAHDHSHDHGGEADWIRISMILLLSAILFIVLTAKDHFLQEHLWQHIIKKHFIKIFLWTFGVIVGIYFVNQYINLQDWISSNLYLVLLIALLIGVIPESGPHYVFVILFAQGALPLSILLASSIVQDGHGSLPLLAESGKGFLAAKVINIAVGAIAGILGIWFGF
ncbi:MAG: putative manganese transporter [Bacteroidales bacterium]|nr:putative manganese transporter [Bacteroidales bacterium]